MDEVDWMYHMRREMQEVLPGLYLGPYSAATKSRFKTLLDHGITHIICIRQSIESHMVRANFPDKIKYLVLDMADNLTQNLIMHLGKCRNFIDECLVAGGKCLVHGNLGISRSAAIVIAYVMEKRSMTYKEALEFVQNRRYCINPNDGFKQQLREYEAIYRAQQTVLVNGQCSQDKGRLKRKHEQTVDWPQALDPGEDGARLPQLDWSGSITEEREEEQQQEEDLLREDQHQEEIFGLNVHLPGPNVLLNNNNSSSSTRLEWQRDSSSGGGGGCGGGSVESAREGCRQHLTSTTLHSTATTTHQSPHPPDPPEPMDAVS